MGLDDLNLVAVDSREEMLEWSSLRFDGMAANLNPPAVTVSNVTLKDLAARIIIETNQVINVLAVVRTNSTGQLATKNPHDSATGSAGSEGSALQRGFAQVKTLLGMETNTLAAGMPKVGVDVVTIENAELQFLDRSVTPPASASLQQVNGTIENVSTEEMRRAQVHFKMLAGGTGPVEISGRLNPLHAKEATEAIVSLKHVKLTPGDPYSAKYLGYRLTRGELNVDVEYTITASQLQGRNVIVLDQLTLGNKVPSPDATSLPVKLGIALLKDSAGKIEIDVPVAGDLDDPQFRLGPVIWHVIGNVFVKAITSPFTLLGSLVGGGGGGEDMQFQEFAPGSTELDAVGREKLATLAKALSARPGLQVGIEGNANPELDGWALRRAKLERQLQTARWNSLRAGVRENLKPEDVLLAPEIRVSLVQDAYRDLIKTNPQMAFVSVPESVRASQTNLATVAGARPRSVVEKGASRLVLSDWTPSVASVLTSTNQTVQAADHPAQRVPLGSQPTLEMMENSLTATQTLRDEDFIALTVGRARRVRECLVGELKVPAERVLISEVGMGSYATNGNRVILQLQ